MSFSKPQSSKLSNTPGPGHYESHLDRPKTPSIKYFQFLKRFGKTKRNYDPLKNEKNSVPGPTHYTPKIMDKSSTPAVSFGKEKRTLKNGTEEVPGPGQYSANYKLGDGVPKVINYLILVFNENKGKYQ